MQLLSWCIHPIILVCLKPRPCLKCEYGLTSFDLVEGLVLCNIVTGSGGGCPVPLGL